MSYTYVIYVCIEKRLGEKNYILYFSSHIFMDYSNLESLDQHIQKRLLDNLQ